MRVLLVDDEVRRAGLVRRGLEAEGFAVGVDGTDGVWRVRERTCNAVVRDILLPGYRICSPLREAGDWTPFLTFTAKEGELDDADRLPGGDHILSKPCSFVVLLARLRALLRRGAPERPAVLVAGDLRFDPASHRGTEVSLTAREFSLLEYHFRRGGQVVSLTEILEHVWDRDYDGDANIVEVSVGHLRKKVDVPLARHRIETALGVGNRLVPDGG